MSGESAVPIAGIAAVVFAIATVLLGRRKVRLPRWLAKFANDPRVMEAAVKAVEYAEAYSHMTNEQKKEVAREFLRKQLARYLQDPLPDLAANFLIELALSRKKHGAS